MSQPHSLSALKSPDVGNVRLGSGDMFGALEAQLSPHAKHALETHTIAFFREGQEMTVGELRAAVRNLYGPAVDDELERHFEARRQAVLPRSPNKADSTTCSK
jgi:hypothetical protein